MKRSEIDRVIQRCFDAEAEDDEMLALREVLKRDPEARLLYFEHAGLHQALDYRLSGSRMTETAGAMTEARLRLQARRSARISLVAAAAAVVVAALALRFIFIPTPDPMVTLEAAKGSVFSVVHSGDSGDREQLGEGSVVRLDQGALELGLRHGSRAVVLAPAAFSVRGEKHLHIDHGSAWFRIERAAAGFEVTTPELSVTDLGTEFGVIAGPQGGHQVHVFEGRVRARSLNPLHQELELGAGQARLSGPAGRLNPVELHQNAFLVRLPDSASDGIIVNGGFESGTPPPDLTYGLSASPALLPGWRFGSGITVVRATSEGRPGYGEGKVTILSSTADTQVGFRLDLSERPPAEDATVYQTFTTEPGREYEVSFEMGAISFVPSRLEVTAAVRDGDGGEPGRELARHIEVRASVDGNGYNPRAAFRFVARSERSTLAFTETSANTRTADPVIDNVAVRAIE